MSNKYILAAIGLAFVRAGEILVAHSEQFTVDDEFIGGVSPARLGMVDAEDDTTGMLTGTATAPAAQIGLTQIANAELDVDGLPWDARIHAGTKTKTQKKQWTRKKGLTDQQYDAVIAELRQQYPAAGTTPTPPATSAPSIPAVSLPSVSVPAVAQTPYTVFVDWLARNTGEGKSLPASWVEEQFKSNNTSLAALANDQELSAEFLKLFRGVLTQMGVAEQ
jgi:hypothetical protein